ncbi:MAG: hypothetical protein RIS86_2324 [Planctomycetota bacterium]|jgi:regulator of protease activity HflC (stomatin/prohibitin superfamily)
MSDGPTDPILGEGEGIDADAPRRAASARFEVAGRDEAGMRDALDPATQSLGEALRLSYRILQLGIVALVVVFLFSGFQSVPEGSTGVKTLFGAIAGAEGEEQVQPGLQPFWPYPVGDLVVFSQKRTLRLDRAFWPASINRGDERPRTVQEQIEAADPNAGLDPARDGSLLTRDGDLAHAQLEVEYSVVDAVKFLESTDPSMAALFVESAVKQGAVEAASSMTIAEITDSRDLLGPAVRERAQRVLDRLDVGIAIDSVRAPERYQPFAVMNRLRDVQTGREYAKGEVERARQEAVATLTQIAGGDVYVELLDLIRGYEVALESDDAAGAEAALLALGRRMEAPDVGGEVAQTILRAKAAETALVSRLERDVRRIDGLVASGGDVRQVVRQLWLQAVAEVLDNPQAEIFAASDLLGEFSLRVASSAEIMQARRDSEIARRKAEAEAREAGGFYAPNSDQIFIGRPGRRLKRDASGGIGR